MIQRIQTVWMLFVAIIASLFIFVSVIEQSNQVLLLKAESGLIAVLSIVVIFLYKNRALQIKLCYGILVLLILSYIILFFSGVKVVVGKLPLVFPFVAGIFDILAILAIKKDEKLVRSLDRLR
ncbi:MAG: DUF4293 domain-containing protein [Dysgonamonadaceae bacterium]|jgi:hypothetical protein|nr:DUF4293 domain-containing protein [Dysgonamonadaceae bacterium]